MTIQKTLQTNISQLKILQNASHICKLPNEIILQIFEQCLFKDAQKLSVTCKFLRALFLKKNFQVVNIGKFFSKIPDPITSNWFLSGVATFLGYENALASYYMLYPNYLTANPFEKIENLGIREEFGKKIDNPKLNSFLTPEILEKVQTYYPYRSFSPLVSKMTHLKEIKLESMDYDQQYRLPSSLVKITVLDQELPQSVSLSFFSSMTCLKWLHIHFKKTCSDSQIGNLPTTITNLTVFSLKISSNGEIFSHQPHLEVLELPYLEITSSLQPLNFPISLTELNLRASNFSNFEGFTSLTRLKVLNLSRFWATGVDHLISLPDLPLQLQKINLDFREIKDLSSLSRLTNLTYLSLLSCKQVKNEQLVYFPRSLKYVEYGHTSITDINPFFDFPYLERSVFTGSKFLPKKNNNTF